MPETPDTDVRWTVDTLHAHYAALREADLRFSDERDRRYSEGNTLREKALTIKETADLAALSLARESQTYKEQQNDALRDKALAESGVYATTASVNAAIEKLEAGVAASFDQLMTKLEPFMSGTIQQKGQQQGSQLTKGSFYSALGGLSAFAAILYAFYVITHPHG
jgi:hypothetical protein